MCRVQFFSVIFCTLFVRCVFDGGRSPCRQLARQGHRIGSSGVAGLAEASDAGERWRRAAESRGCAGTEVAVRTCSQQQGGQQG
jgi:hypothetical protein